MKPWSPPVCVSPGSRAPRALGSLCWSSRTSSYSRSGTWRSWEDRTSPISSASPSARSASARDTEGWPRHRHTTEPHRLCSGTPPPPTTTNTQDIYSMEISPVRGHHEGACPPLYDLVRTPLFIPSSFFFCSEIAFLPFFHKVKDISFQYCLQRCLSWIE